MCLLTAQGHGDSSLVRALVSAPSGEFGPAQAGAPKSKAIKHAEGCCLEGKLLAAVFPSIFLPHVGLRRGGAARRVGELPLICHPDSLNTPVLWGFVVVVF